MSGRSALSLSKSLHPVKVCFSVCNHQLPAYRARQRQIAPTHVQTIATIVMHSMPIQNHSKAP
jgi:hypothetical protein